MFDVRQKFYMENAYRLLNQYNKTKCTEKKEFVEALINCQKLFGPSKSIVNSELLLDGHLRQSTVETVLSNLNYSLVKFKLVTMPFSLSCSSKHTIICFQYTGG